MKTFQYTTEIPKNFTGICKIGNGAICYFKNGNFHREDGPAITYADGGKYWYLNGLSHRESGPSDIYANKYKIWRYKDFLFGTGNNFTNTSWIEKVKEIKRQETLQIFI